MSFFTHKVGHVIAFSQKIIVNTKYLVRIDSVKQVADAKEALKGTRKNF